MLIYVLLAIIAAAIYFYIQSGTKNEETPKSTRSTRTSSTQKRTSSKKPSDVVVNQQPVSIPQPEQPILPTSIPTPEPHQPVPASVPAPATQQLSPEIASTSEQSAPVPIDPLASPNRPAIGGNSVMLAPKDNFSGGIGGKSERLAPDVGPTQGTVPSASSVPEIASVPVPEQHFPTAPLDSVMLAPKTNNEVQPPQQGGPSSSHLSVAPDDVKSKMSKKTKKTKKSKSKDKKKSANTSTKNKKKKNKKSKGKSKSSSVPPSPAEPETGVKTANEMANDTPESNVNTALSIRSPANDTPESDVKTAAEAKNDDPESGVKTAAEDKNDVPESGVKTAAEDKNDTPESGVKTASEAKNDTPESGVKTATEVVGDQKIEAADPTVKKSGENEPSASQ